ncbi:MAG: efflux RND transporter permease subunit [Planctomycetes bacterium]|nr:efflux RND transporter permease subunit [Planctomycetota bacterium]
MRFVDHFIQNPVKVWVCVLLLVLFGLLAIIPPSIAPSPIRAPVQLTPTIDEPVVTVTTLWEGASPEEVEHEILDKQEDMLKSIRNLKKMTGTARQGQGSVELEFEVGTDQDIAKQDVSDALRRVKYQIPQDEFDNPTVVSGREFGEEAIAWIILSSDRDDIHVPDYQIFVEEDVKPMLERVDGIASVGVLGGKEREIQVIVDAHKLARAGVTFGELETALVTQNTNVAAGNSAQGKRDIVLRTMGRFASLEDIRQTVIRTGPGGPIRVGHVAEIKDGFKKQYSFVRSNGRYVLAIPAYRRTGSNVIEAMNGLKKKIQLANDTILAPRGLKLEMTQVYDETTYINASIDMVRTNIYWGSALSIIVLILFLRSSRATLIIAVSIPICVIGTFLIIPMTGRSINVVLLAGLAFATGMVVDNAIVVLENIYRHREMGKSPLQAASDGATEVWGAVLASTLTTMVVFLPIIFVQGEAGQLFRDIAIAISGAVGLSMLVAISVVPVMCSRMLGKVKMASELDRSRLADGLAKVVAVVNRNVAVKLALVAGAAGGSYYFSKTLSPDLDYLPSGNKNLIFGFLITPPGYNTPEFAKIGLLLENGDPSRGLIGIRPFWETKPGTPEHEALLKRWAEIASANAIKPKEAQIAGLKATIAKSDATQKVKSDAERRITELKREIAEWKLTPPLIEDFFFVSFNGGCFMGCSSTNPELVKPLVNVLSSSQFGITDSFAFFFQPGIFKGDAGQSVDIEIRAEDLNKVVPAATSIMMACRQRFGRVEPNPRNFAQGRREDQLIPDRVKAGDLGLNTAEIGSIIRACGDGRIVGQYRDEGRSLDLTIKVAGTEDAIGGHSATAMISTVPIFTPTGMIVPLDSVCRMRSTLAAEEIRHIETQPAVKLTVTPPEGLSLQQVIDEIQSNIITPMRGDGFGPMNAKLDPSVAVAFAGNADKLASTWDSLKWLLALSLLVCYLIMAGLFESFTYPFIIITTVPLAVVGGFVGLWLVHNWTMANPEMPVQKLDVLTILGFVILLGIVVNNGILIVHQALNFMREGMPPDKAIVESVRSRLRPIMMTVLTTLVGQMMLVIRPGSGAEMYRGVGAVVLGGLACSTFFTLFVVPAMLSLFIGARVKLGRWIFGKSEVRVVNRTTREILEPQLESVGG